MAAVKYDDLLEAFEFVSFGPPMANQAYVCLETGTIYWLSEEGPVGQDEVPDDLEDSDRYVAVPNKRDLDLGNDLALRFARAELPGQYSRVQECFHHRAAYARFKDLLSGHGRLDQWYAFEAEETKKALTAWCEENHLTVV